MDRLSEEDYAALAQLQTAVRTNDGGAESTRLQIINRMANQALRTAGIDPTPRPDAAPDSDAAQAATFHRALQGELSAFESSKGRKATAADAYGIVNGLKHTGIKGGWLKVGDRPASPTEDSDIPETDDAFHTDGVPLAQAGPPAQPQQGQRTWFRLDFDRMRRMREEDQQREADEQAPAGTGGAPATDLDPGSLEYRDADAQARAIVAQQDAEGMGGQGGPQTEPPPGSPEYQTAEKEARRVADPQEADERGADRMTTRWLAQEREDGSSPKLPPVLAERLSPAEKEELEALAATPNTQTDREVYNKILSNLLNYNSQVRLKWAREPLFRYGKSLSAEDFAKLARLQSRLDTETGQVIGSAPVPADLVPLYDWLAPDPDWDYGTVIATKGTGKDKDRRVVLPLGVRSFFKGMLDLVTAGERGELTTDALESFMTLHGAAGSTFGPRGGEGTLAAGGKRRTSGSPPSNATKGATPTASIGIGIARSTGAAKSGPGVWRTVNHSMSPRSAAYQTKITGRPANEGYFVGGVEFDGYRLGKLLEAKGEGYAKWVKNGEFLPIFEGRDELFDQMKRQGQVANGLPIIWHVAESAAVDAMRAVLKEAKVKGLTIVHTP